MNTTAKRQPTMMSKKYYSMLLGGTLTMMVVSIMLMTDTFIASAIIGSDAVAGVTLINPVYSFGAFFATIISLGVPILYSTEMGRFNKKAADQAFGFGVLMAIIIGIIMFVIIFIFDDIYLLSSSPQEEVLNHARAYLGWMKYTILVMPMQMLLAAAVYADGDETISTVANAAQGIGNIVFSIILCKAMGTAGIGLASFLFNVVSILILTTHFLKKSNTLRWNLYFKFGLIKKVVSYSIIDSSSYLFMAIMTAAFNIFISSRFGANALIVASVIPITREVQLLFDGIGEAVGPIFGVYVGEKNHDGLRQTYSLANRTAIIEGVIVTVALFIISPFVPAFLNITDKTLSNWAIFGVQMIALGSIFMSLLYLLTSYYLVIEQIRIGVIACALRDVVLSVSLSVVLGLAFGIKGMFVGLAIGPAIAYAIFMLFVRIKYGKDDCPLLLSRVPGDENTYLFNLSVEPKPIIDLQHKVEMLLVDNNIDSKTIGKVKLLIEELYMLIREKNDNKPVLSECTIFIHPDEIKLITKDNGILFDISQEDVAVTSLAAYAVSAYMEKLGENRHHLTTLSYNRSAFIVKTNS